MDACEKTLPVGFLAFYLTALGLFHMMIFRVNGKLPADRKIPHSLYFGGWNDLAREYKLSFPRSPLYQFALTCVVACLIIAVAFTGFRIWEYVTRR